MDEETQLIKGQYQEELKWGSYFFIYGFLISFIISFLAFGLYGLDEEFQFAFSVLQFSVLLIYCSIRCVSEKQAEESLRFFSKLWIAVKVFTIYCFLWIIISGGQFLNTQSLLMRDDRYAFVYKDEDLLPDNHSNLVNDFLNFLQRKRDR